MTTPGWPSCTHPGRSTCHTPRSAVGHPSRPEYMSHPEVGRWTPIPAGVQVVTRGQPSCTHHGCRSCRAPRSAVGHPHRPVVGCLIPLRSAVVHPLRPEFTDTRRTFYDVVEENVHRNVFRIFFMATLQIGHAGKFTATLHAQSLQTPCAHGLIRHTFLSLDPPMDSKHTQHRSLLLHSATTSLPSRAAPLVGASRGGADASPTSLPSRTAPFVGALRGGAGNSFKSIIPAIRSKKVCA
jgi:hypothetical protein